MNDPGGTNVRDGLYKFCVSTIIEGKKLKQFAAQDWGEASEGKLWKTGKVLFNDACEIGARMPVILSDAAYDTSKLLYWGTLRRVDIDGKRTIFRFDDIRRIRGHSRQELVLKSTGRKIAPHCIWPYAICFTPDFLD